MFEWVANLDPRILTVADIAASSLLAIASVVVAATAAWVGHKANVGYRPIVFIKKIGASGGGTVGNQVRCVFKIWNRRKYPLVIHEMQVSFGKVKLDSLYWDGYAMGEWFVSHNNNAAFFDEIMIEPGTQQDFNAEVTPVSRGEGLFDDDNRLTVWVRLYDPMKNRMIVLKAESYRRRFWHAPYAFRIPKVFKPAHERGPKSGIVMVCALMFKRAVIAKKERPYKIGCSA